MPTGYTYKIEEGCTFEEFLWHCVGAFGSAGLHHYYGVGNGVAPDEFKPDTEYDEKKANEAKKRLRDLVKMTPPQIAKQAEKAWVKNKEATKQYSENRARAYRSFESMKAHVVAWKPPTEDHKRLREFMLEQIDLDLRQGPVTAKDFESQETLAPAKWHAEQVMDAAKGLVNATEAIAKERERTR